MARNAVAQEARQDITRQRIQLEQQLEAAWEEHVTARLASDQESALMWQQRMSEIQTSLENYRFLHGFKAQPLFVAL